jgi:hypothetical protein
MLEVQTPVLAYVVANSKYSAYKWYLSVPLWLIIVELCFFYHQHTQLIVKSNVYIYYSIITLRPVSESWFHHQEGY